jgi:predicted MFS family arabinose efflux permease
VAMFSVVAILMRPAVVAAARRVPPATLLVAGAAGVGVATAATTVAESVPAVIALRALAGLGDAFFYVLASTAVYALAPEHRHGSAQSRFSAMVSAGILLGPIVAELLRPRGGYAAVWLTGAVLCAVTCVCVRGLPLARDDSSSGASVARAAVLPGVAVAALTWAGTAFMVFVALYASHAGLESADLPFAVVAAVVLSLRTFGAGLFDRVAAPLLVVVAIAALTAGLALLAATSALPALLVASALVAVGQAFAFPALLRLAVSRAPTVDRTAVVATFTGFFEAGLATGALVLGAVLDRLGFAGLYAVAAAVSLAAALPVALAWRRRGSSAMSHGRAVDPVRDAR